VGAGEQRDGRPASGEALDLVDQSGYAGWAVRGEVRAGRSSIFAKRIRHPPSSRSASAAVSVVLGREGDPSSTRAAI
jgi:hypothetical protein